MTPFSPSASSSCAAASRSPPPAPCLAPAARARICVRAQRRRVLCIWGRADESRRRTCAPATAVCALMQCLEVAAWAGWDRRGGDSGLCRSHAGAAPGATAAAVSRVRSRHACASFKETGVSKEAIRTSRVRLRVFDLKEYIRDMASLNYHFLIYLWVTSCRSLEDSSEGLCAHVARSPISSAVRT